MARISGWIVTCGVANIAFAVLGLGGLAATAAVVLGPASGARHELMSVWEGASPLMQAWMQATAVLGLAWCLTLVPAGIGLFYLRPWAHNVSLAYGVYGLLVALAMIGLNIAALAGPRMLGSFYELQTPGYVLGLLGGCFNAVHPALLLIVLTRPRALAAFRIERGAATGEKRASAGGAAAEPALNPYASPLSSVYDGSADDNPVARGALVLGLLSIVPVAGVIVAPAAIVAGLMGLARRWRGRARGGLGQAGMAIVCGALFGAANAVLVGVLAYRLF